MEIEILSENLLKGLQIVSRILTSKPQLPIISNILLKTVDGQLQITATNLETTLITTVGAKVLTEGEFTVPAKTFLETVSQIGSGKVCLKLIEGQIEIISNNFKSKINGTPAAEWPNLDLNYDLENKLIVSGAVLKDLINKVGYSVGVDENRPALTGILFKISEDSLTVVSTDGFRLSQETTSKVKTKVKDLAVIIPAKIISEVAHWEDTAEITVDFNQNNIVFVSGENKLYSRLINANFPPYEKIIPETTDFSLKFNAIQVLKAVKLAGIFAKDNANIIRLKIYNEKCTISAQAQQTGENESEIEIVADKIPEEEFIVAFNYHYLTDFLNTCGDSEIEYRFSTPITPGLFTITGQKGFLHLIMPVRVQN